MSSWLPQKGERWIYQIRVESITMTGKVWRVRYRPIVLEQQGAHRELDEKTFLKLFSKSGPSPNKDIVPGSYWVLPVEVVDINRWSMLVDYRHMISGEQGEIKQVDVHVFRATFRRDDPAELRWNAGAGTTERMEWRATRKMPERGEKFIMVVEIVETMIERGRMQVRYLPVDRQADVAARVLDQMVFLETFEPLDGAVQGVNVGDRWFMMVKVTDYDPENMAYWYRPVTSKGDPKGDARQLSDHIFVATFRKAD